MSLICSDWGLRKRGRNKFKVVAKKNFFEPSGKFFFVDELMKRTNAEILFDAKKLHSG